MAPQQRSLDGQETARLPLSTREIPVAVVTVGAHSTTLWHASIVFLQVWKHRVRMSLSACGSMSVTEAAHKQQHYKLDARGPLHIINWANRRKQRAEHGRAVQGRQRRERERDVDRTKGLCATERLRVQSVVSGLIEGIHRQWIAFHLRQVMRTPPSLERC